MRQEVSVQVNKAALAAEAARTGKTVYQLMAEELCAGWKSIDDRQDAFALTEQTNRGDVLEIGPGEV